MNEQINLSVMADFEKQREKIETVHSIFKNNYDKVYTFKDLVLLLNLLWQNVNTDELVLILIGLLERNKIKHIKDGIFADVRCKAK